MAEQQRRHWWDDLDDEERARWFRYFTPAQLDAYMASHGLNLYCEDEETLQRAAAIHVAATRRAEQRRASQAAG